MAGNRREPIDRAATPPGNAASCVVMAVAIGLTAGYLAVGVGTTWADAAWLLAAVAIGLTLAFTLGLAAPMLVAKLSGSRVADFRPTDPAETVRHLRLVRSPAAEAAAARRDDLVHHPGRPGPAWRLAGIASAPVADLAVAAALWFAAPHPLAQAAAVFLAFTGAWEFVPTPRSCNGEWSPGGYLLIPPLRRSVMFFARRDWLDRPDAADHLVTGWRWKLYDAHCGVIAFVKARTAAGDADAVRSLFVRIVDAGLDISCEVQALALAELAQAAGRGEDCPPHIAEHLDEVARKLIAAPAA